MPVKRRNHGRGKKNKGKSVTVRCYNCGRFVGKDKAIARFQARNMVDGSSKEDIKAATAFPDEDFYIPKIYVKVSYCVSCAIHARIVRARAAGMKKVRYTTKLRNVRGAEDRKKEQKQSGPAPADAGKPNARFWSLTGSAALPLSEMLRK